MLKSLRRCGEKFRSANGMENRNDASLSVIHDRIVIWWTPDVHDKSIHVEWLIDIRSISLTTWWIAADWLTSFRNLGHSKWINGNRFPIIHLFMLVITDRTKNLKFSVRRSGRDSTSFDKISNRKNVETPFFRPHAAGRSLACGQQTTRRKEGFCGRQAAGWRPLLCYWWPNSSVSTY